MRQLLCKVPCSFSMVDVKKSTIGETEVAIDLKDVPR